MGLARDQVAGSPFLLAQTTQILALAVGIQGRLVESARLWDQAAGTAEQNASPVEALRNLIAGEVTEIRARGDVDRSGLDAALARYPLADMDPIARPYLDIAEGYVLVGSPGEARAVLSEFEASTPTDFQHGLRHQRHRIVGEIARLEGRHDDAIAEFRQSASRPQELEPMILLARAFDSAGQQDSALVHYRQFLGSSHWLSIIPHAQYLAGALERAAELEYEAGNLREAAAYLAEFVNLWADADADLQPRVTAAQARLQEIIDEIG
jgi:tetratricopeptide (TPR) repeat protein